jgi:asparagine synthase (glutamine-hydrolysing)
VNRPKMGFTLPWELWMKNELRTFCEKNIREFAAYDFVHADSIISLWQRFLKNDKRVTWGRIWHLVVLNNWIRTNNISI